MFKYKRETSELDNIRKSTFILNDKIDTVLCLNSDFSINKPFNGLYIKNGKVILTQKALHADFLNSNADIHLYRISLPIVYCYYSVSISKLQEL